ncbi:hypothetical protein EV359DRAFT_68932 [Lentinula novae-zelandiae]|nr:hypothetical protein EV359DRAFT_68932 [Lentinula novae-zelandiae]
MSIFGIEEWECFAPNKAVRPGYEEVLSTEYRELCSMALDQARGATRGRRKAEVRKQEKKNAAAAAEHKKTGTLHFHSGPKNAALSLSLRATLSVTTSHTTTTAHQNGGPPELGEDGDAAANADENMTLDTSKSIALALEAECNFFEKPSVLQRKSTVLRYSSPHS